MAKSMDLTGKVFGVMRVKEQTSRKGGKAFWLCICEVCGFEREIRADNLTSGRTRGDCVCVQFKNREAGKASKLEEDPKKAMKASWRNMIRRCYDTKAQHYPYYGGRGILVSKDWLDSFDNFLLDMQEDWFPGAQISRKDNDGNYNKTNCTWLTKRANVTDRNLQGKKEYRNYLQEAGITYLYGKYVVQVRVAGEEVLLGSFDTQKEAEQALEIHEDESVI